MSTAEQRLRALAQGLFQSWTSAEQTLLGSVAAEQVASCGGPSGTEKDLHAAAWSESQTIRAPIIRWLCADRQATRYIGPKGIHIKGAKINGRLDLQAVNIPFPLCLEDCYISGGVILDFAETRFLSFEGSASGPISGDKLVVHGAFLLRQGFHAKGKVWLVGATIAGDLDCSNGKFEKPGDTALDAGQAQIGGSVSLSDGFRAEGTVRLSSIRMRGDLNCHGGTFISVDIALNANQARIDGRVSLSRDPSASPSQGFMAQGKVTLSEARVAGSLDCSKGIFRKLDGVALDAGRARIGGDLILKGIDAQGTVRLPSTHVDRDLDFREVQSKQMFLDVGGARVRRLLDDRSSWEAVRGFELDDFVYTTYTGPALDAKTRRHLLDKWLETRTLAGQGKRPFRPQPHSQQAKVLRELGQESEAKQVLRAKERARRTHGNLSKPSWMWNLLLEFTIGYGYQPWLALIWAGIFVVVGGILFGMGYHRGIVIPTKAEAYQTGTKTKQEAAFYPAFNRWFYALDTFVPIINFGQKDYWGTQSSCNKPGWIRGGGVRLCIQGVRVLYLYQCLHIVVGWGLITLVVVGFTSLVRKE
jgi:hypothetical protein